MNWIASFVVALWAFYLASLAAWITHIIVCIKAANYLFLLAGGLVFPVGVIHGFGVWLGVW